jgi:hypothetical protein
MTQVQWQQLESVVAGMTDEEKARLAALVQQSKPQTASTDRSLGLFADEPELMDKIMEGVYHDREHRPFRTVD